MGTWDLNWGGEWQYYPDAEDDFKMGARWLITHPPFVKLGPGCGGLIHWLRAVWAGEPIEVKGKVDVANISIFKWPAYHCEHIRGNGQRCKLPTTAGRRHCWRHYWKHPLPCDIRLAEAANERMKGG